MWSQSEIVDFHIRDGNDTAADAAYDKLIEVFSGQPTIPKEIHQIADVYSRAERYDKGSQLYQYVIDNWPKTSHELWAKAGMARLKINTGDDQAAKVILDELIVDFNGYPELPQEIFIIGEQYYNKAFWHENKGQKDEAKDYFRKTITVWERIITELPESSITPQAYYIAGRCYESLGEYEQAIYYFEIVVDNWPDYERAWNAQFMIARGFDKLASSGQIEKSDASAQIYGACEKLFTNYPDCMAIKAAENLLEYWDFIIDSGEVK